MQQSKSEFLEPRIAKAPDDCGSLSPCGGHEWSPAAQVTKRAMIKDVEDFR